MFANNEKEWITPKLKCLIAKRQEAHQSGRQVVRDQLAKQIKMEKRLNTNTNAEECTNKYLKL